MAIRKVPTGPAVDEAHLKSLYDTRRQRYASRDKRGRKLRDILANQYDSTFKDIVGPEQDPVVANIIAAGARTMGQRVGMMPRINCQPLRQGFEEAKKRAEKHEARLIAYSEQMRLDMTVLQAAYWLVAHDLAPLVVHPSYELGIPVIEVKDPLTCYPGTVWPHKPEVYDVLFANRMPAYQAAALYPEVRTVVEAKEGAKPNDVVLGEYFDRDGLTIAILEPNCKILEFVPSPCPGEPLVFLGRGFSPDLDFHGQFDSVIPAIVMQAKLMALAMAYAEQQVFAETVIEGQNPEIASNNGAWAYGPKSVNIIQGGTAQKLTNNMSMQIPPELDRLERYIRIGGAFPAQLSGEPVASIATGKGTESLLTTVDDNTDYWQKVLGDTLERALAKIPVMAKLMNANGAEDFADDAKTYVKFHSGADPAETVRQLQLLGPGVLSKFTIRDGIPEIDDPDKEEAQVEAEQLRQVLMAGLSTQVQQGQMTPQEVGQIIRLRLEKGWSLEKVIENIQSQQQANQPQAQGPPSLDQLLGGAGPQGGQPPGASAPGSPPPGAPQMVAPSTQPGVPTPA